MVTVSMFAYREVPRETWRFLPLKLLYGRYVRGLLKIVRESFEEGEADHGHSQPSVRSYIIRQEIV